EARQLEPGEECESGGLQIVTGRDDGQPGGIAGDGKLQTEEISTRDYLCEDVVLPSETSTSDCSVTRSGSGGASGIGWVMFVLGIAFGMRTSRRRSKFGRRMRIAFELVAVVAAILLLVFALDSDDSVRVRAPAPKVPSGQAPLRAATTPASEQP